MTTHDTPAQYRYGLGLMRLALRRAEADGDKAQAKMIAERIAMYERELRLIDTRAEYVVRQKEGSSK